jgi:hypothetical protein
MYRLIENFDRFISQEIKKLKLDYETEDLVYQKLEALRITTHDNIIVMFWLGVIDIKKLIKFII